MLGSSSCSYLTSSCPPITPNKYASLRPVYSYLQISLNGLSLSCNKPNAFNPKPWTSQIRNQFPTPLFLPSPPTNAPLFTHFIANQGGYFVPKSLDVKKATCAWPNYLWRPMPAQSWNEESVNVELVQRSRKKTRVDSRHTAHNQDLWCPSVIAGTDSWPLLWDQMRMLVFAYPYIHLRTWICLLCEWNEW